MYDFFKIATKETQKGKYEVYPKFLIKKSKDLMIKGGDFYAIWLENEKRWSTDEDDIVSIIDASIYKYIEEHQSQSPSYINYSPQLMHDGDSNVIDKWHKYCQKQMRDNYIVLDSKLIFANDNVKKEDYSSKRLDYNISRSKTPNFDTIINTLYNEEEAHKIMWAIGSIVAGDSVKLQKFVVLYGSAGTGKSTILNIIEQLFKGYYCVFDAKALGSSTNMFALEAFKNNPLVGIQHDGDLSRIEDNTRLNSLVSHELMTVNEKYKNTYTNAFNCFLFMGTNKPVKITDAKSGLLRRLIDITPSGNKLSYKDYMACMQKIKFELGGIAYKCRKCYLKDPNYYDTYVPTTMLDASNDFYNFIYEYHYRIKDGIALKDIWSWYQDFCEDANVGYKMSRRTFKEELKNYFKEYFERYTLPDGTRIRSYYKGFLRNKFVEERVEDKSDNENWIVLKEQPSILDEYLKNEPAQYANGDIPTMAWKKVETKLKDLDTCKTHYVNINETRHHITIDFDRKENGEKSLKLNLEAAKDFPPTYAETSKSGCGLHLHYIYDGDVEQLSQVFDEDIEIKIDKGNRALRRKLYLCNDLPIAHINSGLPIKEAPKVLIEKQLKDERHLRNVLRKILLKEVFPNTKPSVDFIKKVLDDAYETIQYDVSDLKSDILTFASLSTNQSTYCIKKVDEMKFVSKEQDEIFEDDNNRLVFFDIEIFPNLFIVGWKFLDDQKVNVMVNPSADTIKKLCKYKLVGFNNRKYDNHMLYAAMLGYSVEQLFELSNDIINNRKNACFGQAYNLSYVDIYDYASTKQSLKKWEIELRIHHSELGLKWNEPVPKEKIPLVCKYNEYDVLATEATFKATSGDFLARKILAKLANMPINSTTNSLTTKIIFGGNKHPELAYCDLSTGNISHLDKTYKKENICNEFPEYSFVQDENGKWHNMFNDEDIGFGGYVYAEKGVYYNVALLDIASMHPHSAIGMDALGEYTSRFKDLVDARIFIKHKDFEKAGKLFDGALKEFLEDAQTAETLPYALKIAINSVYGLTSANFDNAFKDYRNKNNIVALKGALFMRTLLDEVHKRGFPVVHIKTDSIKIPGATKEIIDFCMSFAEKYGYTFEHEATYKKMCLVNDAVYIARFESKEKCLEQYGYIPEKNAKKELKWDATGTQFKVPYVFKTLFSHEDLDFADLCVTHSCTTAIYLDFNEKLPENEHNYSFVGKVGSFCPVKDGAGGGLLYRANEDATRFKYLFGAKGYKWLEAEIIEKLNKKDDINYEYFENMVDKARKAIEQYCPFDDFKGD